MANEITELDQIVNAMKLAAMTAREHSEQLGLILANQKKQDENIEDLRNSVTMINHRMQNYEDRIRCDRNMSRNIRNSIHARSAELLNIVYVDGIIRDPVGLHNDKYYRSGFISRCYVDARKHSKLGTPYTETYQRDYQEVLDYIAKWQPPTGVEGYKSYLDARRHK